MRARTGHTAAALVSHCLEAGRSGYHVVSVGAGPAIDVRGALAMLPESRRKALRVTLLDLDPDALDYARQRVDPLLPRGGLACVRANLFRLTQAAQAAGRFAVSPAAQTWGFEPGPRFTWDRDF